MSIGFRARVLSGLGVTLVVLAIAVISAYVATSKITESTVNVVEHPLAVTEHLRDFSDRVESMLDLTSAAAQAAAAPRVAELVVGVMREAALAAQDLDEVQTRYLGPAANVADTRRAFADVVAMRDQALALVSAGKHADAVRLLDEQSDRRRDLLRSTFVPIRTFADRRATAFTAEAVTLSRRTQRFLLVLGLLGFLVAAVAGVLSTRFLLQSVRGIAEFAEQIAAGVLSARMRVSGADAFARLGGHLNAMAGTLEQQERRLRDANTRLEQAVEDRSAKLRAANQHLRASEQQLQATNQQLRASNQQLQASEQQLRASNQQLRAVGQTLEDRSASLQDGLSALRCAHDFVEATERFTDAAGLLNWAAAALHLYLPSHAVAAAITFEDVVYRSGEPAAGATCHTTRVLRAGAEIAQMQVWTGNPTPPEAFADQIEHLGQQLSNMLDRHLLARENTVLIQQLSLSSKLAAIGELAAGVGHEINNPLTVLMGYLEMVRAQHSSSNTEFETTMSTLEKACIRIRNIVTGLRRYARVSKADEKVTDVHDCVTECVDMVESMYVKDGITFARRLDAESRRVTGRPDGFQQVLMNMITNARDAFNMREGRIEIRTRNVGDAIEVVVADNGSGIRPDELGRIFDPFFTTKGVGAGTGLGLGISRGIVMEMGGTLTVESAVGVGTSFRMVFPTIAVTQSAVASAAPVLAPLMKGRFLVVDDEPDLRHILLRLLRDAGLDADAVGSGEEALARLRERPCDWLLTDLKMPGMSGETLIREVRAAGLARRVIVITGGLFSDYTVDERGIVGGAVDGFIRKPFQRSDLFQVLGRLTDLPLGGPALGLA